MSAPAKPNDAPITSKTDLVDYIEQGSKPKSEWRIGTEHEKFVFDQKTLAPIPYEGERSIQAVLMGLADLGWTPVLEDGHVIALIDGSGASITLEPGGQLELSGAPLETVHQTCDEVHDHLRQVKRVAETMDIAFLGVGFQPKWGLNDIPKMPKGRYRIMDSYMPKRGGKGLDMMYRTCTVQVNLDFSNEADMVKKLRVSLALQPIATALFASSPFRDGKPSGLISTRADVWNDVDPDRTGTLPFAFEDGMGFERYVDWALDVPMYFVYRQGRYIDASGQSFRDFMAGKLPTLPGEVPTMGDWTDHLTTAFPEVRLKRYLEMRGADGGPWRSLCALPAFWVGLLYDDGALDAAWDLVKDWTTEERETMRHDVASLGMKAPFRGKTVKELARYAIELSCQGLAKRQKLNRSGGDERIFLRALEMNAEVGKSPADEMLEAYHGRWNGSVLPVFKEFAY